MFQWILFWALNLLIVAAGYFFWLRPILRARPDLKWLWDREDSFFAGLRAKMDGIKQKFTIALTAIATMVVTMHDTVGPALTGVDVTPFTNVIAQYVPRDYWGGIGVAFLLLLYYFRYLADKKQE